MTRPFQKSPNVPITGVKVCSTCREELPLDRFGPNKKSADGHAYRCRECNKIRAKKKRLERAEYWLTHDPYSEHPTQRKSCKPCGKTKPVLEFSRASDTADGLQRWCKECQINAWRRRQYGRTLEEGGDCCAICGHDRGLSVDHCHRTGQTRGNLCRSCNTGMGHFNDDPKRLAEAIRYLEEWSSKT